MGQFKSLSASSVAELRALVDELDKDIVDHENEARRHGEAAAASRAQRAAAATLIEMLGHAVTAQVARPLPMAAAFVADDISRMGMRDAIRHVLGQAPRGLRPRDVVEMLEQAGYAHPEGKTDFSTRVTNDLSKMARTGKLTKQGSYYFLPSAENDALSS